MRFEFLIPVKIRGIRLWVMRLTVRFVPRSMRWSQREFRLRAARRGALIARTGVALFAGGLKRLHVGGESRGISARHRAQLVLESLGNGVTLCQEVSE